MADPFQNVDAAGPEFIKTFADVMDARQSEPAMEKIVADYLGLLTFAEECLTIEVGAGAGAISRRIAARAAPEKVIGYEPSVGFVEEARQRVTGLPNLTFEVANGAELPLEDNSADHVILHTVLTHVPEPARLITEARRVLKHGGKLVICDADFSKATLSNFPNDPLDACAREFVREFVTDPHVVAKLKQLLASAGLNIIHFNFESRVATNNTQMLPWVESATRRMAEHGGIGQELAKALLNEQTRRGNNGQLYGFLPFATAIGQKA